MRVVVVGASGNVGTSVLEALAREPAVDSILAVARRMPAATAHKVDWQAADISRDELAPLFRGADAVVHLAWLIQPSRREDVLRATNVDGSVRVFQAVADANVPSLVYASSVGAYAPGPKDRAVDESWPTTGIASSFYSRHKAEVEAMLDRFEREHPSVRVVRLRPGLIFKRQAASEIRRYFIGPFLPSPLVHPRLIPVFPAPDGLRFQAVHSHDVADAYRLTLVNDESRGAYNIAADPVLDVEVLRRLLEARPVPVPHGVLASAAALTWRLRLQPSPRGWVDMGLGVPIMDVGRARRELGWRPSVGADEALSELLEGLRHGAGDDTPPLDPGAGGPARVREVLTGVGER